MDSDSPGRRGRLHGFSINRLIPNILTLAALCSGLTALAAVGEKVLIIDLDPQGNASTGLGIQRRPRTTAEVGVIILQAAQAYLGFICQKSNAIPV